ncbi:MAG: 3-deoxy-D-manno-octulosonic-acid transferase [Chthoniobacter sp.]|jgi:3-deoxy-D-manno-octulosonic-acid transferase|nr:3-deoxy-D-manno-octulosonic-acid transferase [Chthoniobacter sp.]
MIQPLPSGLRLRLLVYNCLFPFVLLFMLPGLMLRMVRRGQFRRKFGERFGRYDQGLKARFSAGEWTWIHSISVGETLLALKLARAMKETDPGLQVVLSVTTSTGFAIADKARADWLEAIYNPLDVPVFVRRALNAIRPARLVFVEAVWPNLLALAKQRGTTVSLIARLSPRSENRFRKFRFFAAPMFRALDAISVQEPDDVARWQSLGVAAERVHVTGNIKFDEATTVPRRVEALRALLTRLGVQENTLIFLAGSTFPGEERIVAEVFRKLRARFPQLFLIIVPRHVERTDQAAADVLQAGVSFSLRTASEPRPADCLIVNTTGELSDWYLLSTVVFIGKSLTAIGGQNPVEAVLAGKPVIFGPHMENFQAIVSQWLAHDAAVQIANAEGLEAEASRLLADPVLREHLAARARKIVTAHQGATARTARLLLGK